jgi:hypothetical protein
VPFIRQTRDKRGFEQTYVMHNARPGVGSVRPRVLYIFRSPANVRIGRRALDAEVREALEHTHPDLSFDWNALTREAVVTRPDPQPLRPARGNRPRSAPPPQAPAAPAPSDDASLVGRVLGAEMAARIRARYAGLTERISRRARTPEERDALLERARRLNPDAWPDEAAVEARRHSIESELDALASALPPRRRGRRGGRHRQDAGPIAPGMEPSGIMASGDERHENLVEGPETGLDPESRPADPDGGPGVSPADPEAAGFPDID